MATVAPNPLSRPIPLGKERIPAQTPSHLGTQQDRRKVPDPQELGTGTPKLKRPPLPLWMSPDSIRLVDKRAALWRNPWHSRNLSRGVTRAFWRSLMAESQRQAEVVATKIGACLGPSTGGADPRGAYAIPKHWYRHASARVPNPSRTDMEKVRGTSKPSIRWRIHTPLSCHWQHKLNRPRWMTRYHRRRRWSHRYAAYAHIGRTDTPTSTRNTSNSGGGRRNLGRIQRHPHIWSAGCVW